MKITVEKYEEMVFQCWIDICRSRYGHVQTELAARECRDMAERQVRLYLRIHNWELEY